MTDEIEYRYVKGKGWVAGYKQPGLSEYVTFTINMTDWRIRTEAVIGPNGNTWRFVTR